MHAGSIYATDNEYDILEKSYGGLEECPQFVDIRTFVASTQTRCFSLRVDFGESGKQE